MRAPHTGISFITPEAPDFSSFLSPSPRCAPTQTKEKPGLCLLHLTSLKSGFVSLLTCAMQIVIDHLDQEIANDSPSIQMFCKPRLQRWFHSLLPDLIRSCSHACKRPCSIRQSQQRHQQHIQSPEAECSHLMRASSCRCKCE